MINEYETQSTLNPKLWVNDQLKPSVRKGFLKIADHFYDFLEINATIKDIILIGSNANYNWTKYSDVDLHVVINYLEIGNNLHLVSNYLHAKKSVWNTNYPLTFKGMNIELYAQDSNENLHSSVGIYSVLQNKWIQQPNSNVISIDDDAIQQKTQPYEYEIDNLSDSDPHIDLKIKDILKRLRNLRQTGLESEGEYSVENLAYKSLRNSGHLDRLKELLRKNTIGQLTIDESVISSLADHISKRKTLSESDWLHIVRKTNGVEDPMGQWRHPGRCTMIPNNQITMQNVGYPVLGIDDTGYMHMMKPEQKYTYPGTQVFEIPMTARHKTWLMQLMNRLKNGGQYD
jgi:hypothetical protein